MLLRIPRFAVELRDGHEALMDIMLPEPTDVEQYMTEKRSKSETLHKQVSVLLQKDSIVHSTIHNGAL